MGEGFSNAGGTSIRGRGEEEEEDGGGVKSGDLRTVGCSTIIESKCIRNCELQSNKVTGTEWPGIPMHKQLLCISIALFLSQ